LNVIWGFSKFETELKFCKGYQTCSYNSKFVCLLFYYYYYYLFENEIKIILKNWKIQTNKSVWVSLVFDFLHSKEVPRLVIWIGVIGHEYKSFF